jgi:hypothetical protein
MLSGGVGVGGDASVGKLSLQLLQNARSFSVGFGFVRSDCKAQVAVVNAKSDLDLCPTVRRSPNCLTISSKASRLTRAPERGPTPRNQGVLAVGSRG